ncbi:ribonuclease P/MRP protein subunit POP5 [Stigmatopora nigra]
MVRVKWRYLVCEINVLDKKSLFVLSEGGVASAVKNAVASIHGDYGSAMLARGDFVKYLNTFTGIVVIRFPKKYYKILWSALPFITSIETNHQSVPCFLNCLHIGGTIRTCQRFLISYSVRQLHRMLPNCKNEAERREVRKAILSCSYEQDKRQGNQHDDDAEEF